MAAVNFTLGVIFLGAALESLFSQNPWWYCPLFFILGLRFFCHGVLGFFRLFESGMKSRQEPF